MPAEQRTRVEVFLPVRTDIPSYQIVTDWLAEEVGKAILSFFRPLLRAMNNRNDIDLVFE